MRPFTYTSALQPTAAVKALNDAKDARYLAGGTNLLDLMKEDVERPDTLVDIGNIPDRSITGITSGINKGGVQLSAFAKNTESANHPLVRKHFPLLTQAILSGATVQLRNMASNGGNLNQRTRCPYFYETSMPCNKREPGTGCGALKGQNRLHAIFGWSDACVAVHPSDMCVGLAALNAAVKVMGVDGQERWIPFDNYHRLPGNTPEKDNNLQPGELVIGIEIPPNNFAQTSCYIKVRDRASYAFALVSVAAGIELKANNIEQVRLAIGGVAHKPWRAFNAENYLRGKAATDQNFALAAEAEIALAKPLEHNGFKVELVKKAIVRALMQSMQGNKTA